MDSRNKFSGLVFDKRLKIALTISLAVLTQCAPAIKGKVSDLEGNSLYSETARVNITPIGSESKAEVSQLLTINSDGTFKTKEGLTKGGTYMVEVLLPGYEIFAREVLVENDLVMDLKLKPLGKLETKTIQVDLNVESSRGSGGATLTPPKF